MAMNIRFFSSKIKSGRASHRLRGELIAKVLQQQGLAATALSSLDDVNSDTVFVALKHSQPEHLVQARQQGATVVYDLCDNKFDEKEEYLPCCLAADFITVNSEQMGVSVKERTGKDSIVIPDPCERPELPPTFNNQQPIQLMWFGSSASLKFVDWITLWQRLEREIGNYHFTMVTAKAERLVNKMKERERRGIFTGVNFDKISILDWTWELQGEKLRDCDIVLMPVQVQNYRTDTKSANRLVDSLISGKFVVTSPLASYVEFDTYTWQQEDYIEGVKWAQAHPGEVLDRITRGQEYTKQNYSPEVIAQQWWKAAEYAIKNRNR